jgi:hypothetical protein
MGITFCSEKITELAKAMILVQEMIEPASKDGQNASTDSNYATLNSVVHVSKAAMLKFGIWHTQYPVPAKPGHLGLVTKIVHSESGQWQASLIVMPLPQNDPQGYGSAITYARRYGLSALVGIITENDDDAELACGRTNHSKPSFTPSKTRPKSSEKPAKRDPQMSSIGNENITKLPHLDGVKYENGKTQDGKICVFAKGNTHSKKEFLKTAGFHWDGNKKLWWRSADAA